MLALKKTIVTALMFAGLLVGLALLVEFKIPTLVILASVCLMGLGPVLYHWLLSGPWWWGVYGLGTIMAGGVVMVQGKRETLLWIIPMAWEVLVLALDRIIGKESAEQ